MIRLWLSYQRYTLLLGMVPPALTVAVLVVWPAAWWAWAPLGLITLWLLSVAAEIYGRWPRKIRATLLADRRIAAGRFRPEMVRRYCGDPCFRVVAREILRRAGLPATERRTLVHRFRIEADEADKVLVLVNHADGVLFHIDGSTITRHPLSAAGPTPTEQET